MKRDMDLIRDILLRLEEQNLGPGVIRSIYFAEILPHDTRLNDISYNLQLIVDNGLVKTASHGYSNGHLLFAGLSWSGHVFLDSVRDPDVWKKTKEGALAAGGFTFQLLVDLGKGFAKKKLEEATGIKL